MKSLMRQMEETRAEVDRVISNILSEDKEPSALYEATKHLLEAGGKRLRSFITLKACEIVGGRREDALLASSAIELLHAFTLIHDDIMDQSEKRRGVPSVHIIWGVPLAIDAGDMLFAKVYDTLTKYADLERIPLERVMRMISILSRATRAICRGQAYDLLFEERKTITEDEYLNMIKWKTATLFEASAEVGAIIGGGEDEEIERLGSFALNLGMAFQIKDDILGVIGEEDIVRKPVGGDLKQGKKTIIIAYALENCTDPQRDEILSTLGNRDATPEDLRKAVDIIREVGAIDYASDKAVEFVEKAKGHLEPFPESDAKESLLRLADFVVVRRY